VVCGLDGSGQVEVTMEIVLGPQSVGLDPAHGEDTFTFTLDLVGEPANITLAANPGTIGCDGIATSTVSATVTDAEGNLAINGTEVRFDVQVLGTANPIVATTTDGIANTTVTPLAIEATGVPVIGTAGSAQGSTLVNCSGVAPGGEPPPPPPTGPGTGQPGGSVQPPDTGTGGDFDGSGSMSIWPALALALGAAALIGARLRLRRVE
jgi:hypothetical protein